MIQKIIYISIVTCCCFSCGEKPKENHNNTHKPKIFQKLREPNDNEIIKLNRQLIAMVELEEGEAMLFDGIKKEVRVSDSLSVYLIPIEGNLLNRYIIALISENYDLLSIYSVKGVWIDNDEQEYIERLRLLKGPLITLEDIDLDGSKDLIIKDRQHVGNVYNAALKHIFNIKNDSIKYVGSYEYINHLPVEDAFIIRDWDVKNSKMFVFKAKEFNDTLREKIGEFNMKIIDGEIFISNEVIFNDDYSEMIISIR